MLDTLSEPLLGEVLRWLRGADLKSARLACRAANAAARSQLESRLWLMLDKTAGGHPDWARWPRLTKLCVDVCPYEQHEAVQRLFAPPRGAAGGGSGAGDRARAVLAAVATLELNSAGCSLELPAFAELLAALPGLTALTLLGEQAAGEDAAALLSVVAEHAPQLRALDADDLGINQSGVAAIWRMRQLRALQLGWREQGVKWEPIAPALPGPQLTALSFNDEYRGARVTTLPWPQLRALLGVTLFGEDVAALAAGLPQLQRLAAYCKGDWDAVPLAGFERVTHARLRWCWGSYTSASLSTLLPSVQSLTLALNTSYYFNADKEIDFNLCGLTALSSLAFEGNQRPNPMSQRMLAGLCALPSLAHLSLRLATAELPLLARLPTSLVALDLTVVLPSVGDAGTDIGSVLLAMAPLSRLTRLHLSLDFVIYQNTTVVSHALSRFVQSLPALSELALCVPRLRLHEVSALCMHACLRTLHVDLAAGEDRIEFDRLASDCASRGLALQGSYHNKRITPICDDEWTRFECAA